MFKKLSLAVALTLGLAVPAWADGTIDTLSAGSALTGTESIPMFQTANPAVKTTPSAIGTYYSALSITETNKTLTSPTINAGALSGTFSGNPTISGVPIFSGLSGGTCALNLVLDSGNHLVTAACPAGSGISGLTTGQLPIAGSATTLTSSVPFGQTNSSSAQVVETTSSGTIDPTFLPGTISTGDSAPTVTAAQWASGHVFVGPVTSITLPAATTLSVNGNITVNTIGTGAVSLIPNAADGINGGAINTPVTLPANSISLVTTTGSSGTGAIKVPLGFVAGANITFTANSGGYTTIAAAGAGTGNVSATTTSTNKLQKGTGTLTIGDSSITDNGTSVTTTEPTVFNNTVSVANEGSTGTTVNKLAKLTGAPSTAIIIATTDMSGISGIVVSGAGTTGNALITRSGQAPCAFDGATTAGDYVQASSSTAGDCHDAGPAYPTNGQVLGRVLSTNGSGGTYTMNVIGAEVNASNPVATGSGGSVTLTGPQEVYFCTGTCTATLPALVVGQEYCVANNAAVTSVITLAALGGSAVYEKTDWSGYGTAGTGTLTSGGAAGDSICLHVLDTTHVQVMSSHGTWTAS